MFLRDCAMAMRFDRAGSPQWIWYFGTLATSLTLSCFAVLIVFVLAVLLRAQLPESLNPLTAPMQTVYIEMIGLVVLVGTWVDYRFREYKDHLSAANAYMTGPDTLKWWIATLLAVACLGGMTWLVVIGKFAPERLPF